MWLTSGFGYVILVVRKKRGSFFFALILFIDWCCIYRRKALRENKAEVKLMRTKITLECTECKQRNYNTTKDKKTHPDRVETKKYCKFCKKHTMHKETK